MVVEADVDVDVVEDECEGLSISDSGEDAPVSEVPRYRRGR